MIAAAYIAILLLEAPLAALIAWHTHTPWPVAVAATIAATYLTLGVLIHQRLRR